MIPSAALQGTWLNKLQESQDKYKDALRRGQDGVTPAYETSASSACPASPHVKIPSVLKSNLPPAEKPPAAAAAAAAAGGIDGPAAPESRITVQAQVRVVAFVWALAFRTRRRKRYFHGYS